MLRRSDPLGEGTRRRQVLATVAQAVSRRSSAGVVRVGIDGVDGAGKTHFADELAELLRASGRPTIRASVDGFHHTREAPSGWNRAGRMRAQRGNPEATRIGRADTLTGRAASPLLSRSRYS